MATNLTNSILTQIAVKRLSGKAMSSGQLSIPQEKFGSAVQSSAETIFGEAVPNAPISSSGTIYTIQSASDGAPGTVQQVTLELTTIVGSNYANPGTDTSTTLAEQTVFGADLGDPSATNTFHAYYVSLPSNYETLSTSHFGNASTPKTLGGADSPYSDNFASTGSTQFQIVPEYLSTLTGTSNPYIPEIIATNGVVMDPSIAIDYYFDPFAGILFVQDPAAAAGTPSNASVPEKIRAFLYVGKYQSEIEGGSPFHISASEGGGFNISGNATASFESGSGEGLTVTADPNSNTITFELVNVISSSAQLPSFNVSASTATANFDVSLGDTASFVDGGAGLTVETIAGNKVQIGKTTDSVTFTNITALGDITAENYIVSSTIMYMTAAFSSGNTIFGDTLDDTHQFTGSIFVTGSTFTWDGLSESSTTTPLVIDENGNITIGPAFSAATGIHLSASGDDGFTLQSSDTASFKSGNSQLVIDATAASNEILFTVGGGLLSSSAQIADEISGSMQWAFKAVSDNGTEYTNSVGSLDTASILSGLGINITPPAPNVPTYTISVDQEEFDGIYFSASNGGTTINLGDTASFEGGDGITVTNSGGTITIESDYGELNSAIHIGTGSDVANADGASIGFGGTASFDASGTGLTVDNDGAGVVTYTVDPNTLIEAVDTATVINITASYALTASFVTSSDVYGPFGADSVLSASYAVTASYVEGGSSTVQVTELDTSARYGVIQSDLLQSDLINDTVVNEDVTLQGWQSLAFNPGRNQLFVGPPNNYVGLAPGLMVIAGTGTPSNTFNFLTTGLDFDGDTSDAPETINIGTGSGTVYFQGSASIEGDLIVKGSTTTLNTETLLVEDPYILLASSSAANTVGGGIVVQRGSTTSGTALHWDETEDVWAVQLDTANASTATAKTIDFNLVGVKQASGNPSTAPAMGVGDYKLGQMYINTTDTDNDGNTIWIYAT